LRFTFQAPAAAKHGVRVVPEIPDIRLAQVEGRNGIGKTLAARLLELVSGEQPFAALPRAWESLVDLLGEVEITIDGLGDDSVAIRLNSSEWKGRTQVACAVDPGQVSINGVPSTWPDFRKRLQVRRIAGDEGLAETLGLTLRERSLAAEAGFIRASRITEDWSHRLDALRLTCGDVSPMALEAARAAHESDLKSWREQVEFRDQRVKSAASWTAAVEALESIVRMRAEAPGLLDLYREHFDQHRNAESLLKPLELQLADEGANAVVDSRRRAELGQWNHRLELRETAAAKARLEERRILSYLGLEDRPEAKWRQEELVRLRAAVSAAKAELKTADLAGTVRQAITRVLDGLDVIPPGARNETVAELAEPISAAELIRGAARRRTVLEGVPRPGQAIDLSRRVDELEGRILVVSRLADVATTTERKEKNVREARDRVDELIAGSGIDIDQRHRLQSELATQRDLMVSGSAQAVSVLTRLQSLLETPLSERVGDLVANSSASEDDDVDPTAEDLDLGDEIKSILREPDDVVLEVETWLDDAFGTLDGIEVFSAAELENLRSASDVGPSRDLLDRAILALAEELREVEAAQTEAITRDEHTKASEAQLAALRSACASGVVQLLGDGVAWSPIRKPLTALFTRSGLSKELLTLDNDGFLSESAEKPVAAVLAAVSRLAVEVEDSASIVRDAWGTTTAYLNYETRKMAPRIASSDSLRSAASLIADSNVESTLRRWTERELGRGDFAGAALRFGLDG
jgi:hypothetical protein